MARRSKTNGSHGVHGKTAQGRKAMGQTIGQSERDPKRRRGQYGGAGNAPLIKK